MEERREGGGGRGESRDRLLVVVDSDVYEQCELTVALALIASCSAR